MTKYNYNNVKINSIVIKQHNTITHLKRVGNSKYILEEDGIFIDREDT